MLPAPAPAPLRGPFLGHRPGAAGPGGRTAPLRGRGRRGGSGGLGRRVGAGPDGRGVRPDLLLAARPLFSHNQAAGEGGAAAGPGRAPTAPGAEGRVWAVTASSPRPEARCFIPLPLSGTRPESRLLHLRVSDWLRGSSCLLSLRPHWARVAGSGTSKQALPTLRLSLALPSQECARCGGSPAGARANSPVGARGRARPAQGRAMATSILGVSGGSGAQPAARVSLREGPGGKEPRLLPPGRTSWSGPRARRAVP